MRRRRELLHIDDAGIAAGVVALLAAGVLRRDLVVHAVDRDACRHQAARLHAAEAVLLRLLVHQVPVRETVVALVHASLMHHLIDLRADLVIVLAAHLSREHVTALGGSTLLPLPAHLDADTEALRASGACASVRTDTPGLQLAHEVVRVDELFSVPAVHSSIV